MADHDDQMGVATLPADWGQLKKFLEQSLPANSCLRDANELVEKLKKIYQGMFGPFGELEVAELDRPDFKELSILEKGVLKKYLSLVKKSAETPAGLSLQDFKTTSLPP
eukprot:CAMPEP_0201521414 /NCGR_PEP_ID=MMETSP0161_2-20130828/14401_1 /ASSEMBLY_ACC=CAM_ASM_000251 /TAXON_ID=180227 /ORGANISM="Neoparamoeba aestuarina, Strain SoJaBio B1-5/56/2" /LENGTH=108 /DNA_ID=CAMNT_0047920047 /DNA_START=143 /DNA_END=465 /DNA_ORIENTATION=+